MRKITRRSFLAAAAVCGAAAALTACGGSSASSKMCIRDRPEALLAANQEHCIRMPMRDTCRSLNLSNSVAVGVYEVLRQWDFPELLDHGHLRDYEWK